MKFLLPLAAAAEAVADKAPEVGGGGTQGAIDNALWQYPVAALVVFVVFIFLRYMKKEREAQQTFLAETNKLDREDREKAQLRFTDTLKAVQTQDNETTKEVVESFKAVHTQATSQQNAILTRAVDVIDKNTEAIGEFKTLVEITRNQRVMRDDDDDEEDEVQVVVKKRKKKRRPKPKPEPEEEYEDEDEDEGAEDE